MTNESSRDVDPFDTLMNLEEEYYARGYQQGVSDGLRAGRNEGRMFGLERGFEKFLEMGRLSGQAAVLSVRFNASAATGRGFEQRTAGGGGARLEKHVQRLTDLTDSRTLSTENSEDAVAEFEERLRDAKARAMLISKNTGEGDPQPNGTRREATTTDPLGAAASVTKTREMEDFVGVPTSKKPTSEPKP